MPGAFTFRNPLSSLALVIALAFVAGPAGAAATAPCRDDSAFGTLDFWLGEWEVRVDDRVVGANRIEKILSGCALMEHWTAAGGGEGKSLFYYDPVEEEWNQVWVTEDTTRPGGLKEKRLDDGGVRFQGEVSHPERGTYLDRTTLTPLPGDRVRQLLEISVDGGETWRPVFDGLYVRPGTATPAGLACPALEGLDGLPSEEMIVFGELHGTDRSPAAFGAAACRLGREHGELVVGLEIPSAEQGRIDAFLASEGTDDDRHRLLAGEFWGSSLQDGRQSRAMVELLDDLRELRASGVDLEVVAFDPLPDAGLREEGLARNLAEDRERHPEVPFLVLTGNLHPRTARGNRWDPDFRPMGALLEAAGVAVFPVDVRHAGGSAWLCTGSSPDDCGPRSVRGSGEPRDTPALELFPEPDPDTGYAGALWVGEVDASPPAVSSAGSIP